jgi:FkbM family methyltransferase
MFPPSLMLDVGAAIGGYTRLIRQNNPGSRVAAFEPFAGNWPYFEQRVGDDPMVTLHRCAVSDKCGTARFRVSSTVNATSGFWSQFPGSSSMGTIVDAGMKTDKTFEVQTVALDDLFSEPVHFMKVDVQGAEEEVLSGCEQLWQKHGVEAMSIEFSGREPSLLEMIGNRNYEAFDTTYNIILTPSSDLSDWIVLQKASLSTGNPIVFAWPKQVPSSPADYLSFM